MTLKDLIEIVVAFLGGATIAAVVTFKYTKTKFSRVAKTTQRGNVAGGHIIGGDYNRK
jgi:hypothetical protein